MSIKRTKSQAAATASQAAAAATAATTAALRAHVAQVIDQRRREILLARHGINCERSRAAHYAALASVPRGSDPRQAHLFALLWPPAARR